MRVLPAFGRAAIVVVAAIAASAAPAQAQHCAPFTDVLASSMFCNDIQWIYNRGITRGCATNQFCPAEFVRRDQIAAFLYRLGFENAFLHGGNAFGEEAVLGTTDGQALEVRVGNARVMRYEPNAVSPNVIGGHLVNNVTAGVRGATIAGGGVPFDPTFGALASNRVTDAYGTVGGGYGNRAGDDAGTPVDSAHATVGGGVFSAANAKFSTVAGGSGNVAIGESSTVTGGVANGALGFASTVAGGAANYAGAMYSSVAGGFGNNASGISSFAAGYAAIADQNQCFVFANWSDSGSGSCLGTTNIARFLLDHGLSVEYFSRHASGGGDRWVHIGDVVAGQTIATWTGAYLTDAGVWVNAASSKEVKTDVVPVDPSEVLDKVAALPISTWRYKQGEAGVRHIGPMAEDFHTAFDVGYGPHTIADLDARGVALAAIQGLNAKLEKIVADQRRMIAALETRLRALEARLAAP